MKVALFTSLAIFAVCGLALADDGFFGNDNGFGIGGLAGGFSSWGGAGYGGGLGGYKGGLGGYGKAQYVPLPLPAQGARGGSGGLGGLATLLLLLFILPLFFNRSSGSNDNVIFLNSSLRG